MRGIKVARFKQHIILKKVEAGAGVKILWRRGKTQPRGWGPQLHNCIGERPLGYKRGGQAMGGQNGPCTWGTEHLDLVLGSSPSWVASWETSLDPLGHRVWLLRFPPSPANRYMRVDLSYIWNHTRPWRWFMNKQLVLKFVWYYFYKANE